MSPGHRIALLVWLNQTERKNHYAKAMRAMGEVAQAGCNVQNTVFEGFVRAVWADQGVWLARSGLHLARAILFVSLDTLSVHLFEGCRNTVKEIKDCISAIQIGVRAL